MNCIFCKKLDAVFDGPERKASGECNPCAECKGVLIRARNYGLNLFDYYRIMSAQDYRCAICRELFGEETPHIDHCHTEEHVRGLLCRRCNQGLGFFKDSLPALRNAVAYLQTRRPQKTNRGRVSLTGLRKRSEEKSYDMGKSLETLPLPDICTV